MSCEVEFTIRDSRDFPPLLIQPLFIPLTRIFSGCCGNWKCLNTGACSSINEEQPTDKNEADPIERKYITCKDLTRILQKMRSLQDSCKAMHFLKESCKNLARILQETHF